MYYAMKFIGDDWIELERSRDRNYLHNKYLYEDVDIIGGW